MVDGTENGAIHSQILDRPPDNRGSTIDFVAREVRVGRSGRRDVEDLLPLTLSDPREALVRAREVLAGQPDDHDASVAHQAAGIALRELGDVDAGVGEVRKALSLASRRGSAQREADVLATPGVALVYSGHTVDGLAAFDRALRKSSGVAAGRVLVRRGQMLWT